MGIADLNPGDNSFDQKKFGSLMPSSISAKTAVNGGLFLKPSAPGIPSMSESTDGQKTGYWNGCFTHFRKNR
jgi:hypothetical protein